MRVSQRFFFSSFPFFFPFAAGNDVFYCLTACLFSFFLFFVSFSALKKGKLCFFFFFLIFLRWFSFSLTFFFSFAFRISCGSFFFSVRWGHVSHFFCRFLFFYCVHFFFNSYIVKRFSRLACLCMRFFFWPFFSWVYNLLVTCY